MHHQWQVTGHVGFVRRQMNLQVHRGIIEEVDMKDMTWRCRLSSL